MGRLEVTQQVRRRTRARQAMAPASLSPQGRWLILGWRKGVWRTDRESAEVEEVRRHLKKKHRKPWRQTRTEAQRGEATSLKLHITEPSAHPAPLKPTTSGRLCTAGPRPPRWGPLIRFQPVTEAAFVSSLGNHISSLTEPTRQCGHAQEVAGNPRPWALGPAQGGASRLRVPSRLSSLPRPTPKFCRWPAVHPWATLFPSLSFHLLTVQ